MEHLGHIRADVGVRRQQPDVLVGLRGSRVVVATSYMAVAAGVVTLATDHQGHLAVGLDAAEPVDHLDPGVLQRTSPGDVGPFIEPGLQLHDRRDLFA